MSVTDSWLLIASTIGLTICVWLFLEHATAALVAWWTDQPTAEEVGSPAEGKVS